MAIDQTGTGYGLPCGRSVDRVWEDLEAGRVDEHGLACPHCETTRESLRALRAATSELAADPTEPSPGFTDRIMAAVRADVRRRDMVSLPEGIRISEQAIATVLRFAADEIPGVRARRCRLRTVAEGDEIVVEAELTLAVSYRYHTPEALDAVRARVNAACSARIGLRLGRLDLTVGDIYEG